MYFIKKIIPALILLVLLAANAASAQRRDPNSPYCQANTTAPECVDFSGKGFDSMTGDYHLFTPLPDAGGGNLTVIENQGSEQLGNYLNLLFQIFISAAILIAVITIMIAGVMYITTASSTSKGKAREMISGSIWGLVLALASWLILSLLGGNSLLSSGIEFEPITGDLYTINPRRLGDPLIANYQGDSCDTLNTATTVCRALRGGQIQSGMRECLGKQYEAPGQTAGTYTQSDIDNAPASAVCCSQHTRDKFLGVVPIPFTLDITYTIVERELFDAASCTQNELTRQEMTSYQSWSDQDWDNLCGDGRRDFHNNPKAQELYTAFVWSIKCPLKADCSANLNSEYGDANVYGSDIINFRGDIAAADKNIADIHHVGFDIDAEINHNTHAPFAGTFRVLNDHKIAVISSKTGAMMVFNHVNANDLHSGLQDGDTVGKGDTLTESMQPLDGREHWHVEYHENGYAAYDQTGDYVNTGSDYRSELHAGWPCEPVGGTCPCKSCVPLTTILTQTSCPLQGYFKEL